MKAGMYVRCSIEFEHPDKPRRFAIGRIVRVDTSIQEVEVAFFLPRDAETMHEVYRIPTKEKYPIPKVTRSKILAQSPFIHAKSCQKGKILSFSHVDLFGFHHYFVQMEEVSAIGCLPESELLVPITRGDIDVLDSFENYEFHNPRWYLHRQIVVDSLHTLRNATFGFETLIGSRVFLMEHQVDTIVRAISEDPCRFMLADEVGLGKTIEAAVIMRGLQKRLGHIRILLIVPESLLYQWRNEMSYKFWTDFTAYDGERDHLDKDLLLFPLEKINTRAGQMLLRKSWDLCVVDETHRLLTLDTEYDMIYAFSQKVPHLLLLSATPIQSRQTEFLRLVRLLDPQKYGKMGEEQFGDLLEKQAFLRRKVHRMMQDLPDYYEDELAEGFQEDLMDIADVLRDQNFHNLVEAIDIKSEDEGLSQVKLALAYLGEHYQIERKILRHRRKQIESSLGKRTLHEETYLMAGSDVQYYESDTYDALIDYLEYIESSVTDEKVGKFKRLFLSSMFSSPWALASLVRLRKAILKGDHGAAAEDVTEIIMDIPHQSSEQEYVNVLSSYVERWMKATEQELKRVDECFDDPDLIQGRLMKAIDHLLSNTDKEKVVVFSSWKETLLPLEKVLAEKFGKDGVKGFYAGKSDKELQEAVDDFQNNEGCRFMLCDPLGGEGRNFQMADRILHLDLPWNPSHLEQRIGRLDRIGRKGDVLSVVVYSEGTIEEQLLQIWKEGLQIFRESLSGIEIAIQDIQDEMTKALTRNLRFGLQDVMPSMQDALDKMRERVQEERYFDMARQLDRHVQEQLMSLIRKFDADGGLRLAETMLQWAKMTGLHGKSLDRGKVVSFNKDSTVIKSMVRTLFLQPDNSEMLRRAGRVGEVRGTFMREIAVAREKLAFYAPGNSLFDSIVDNAQETDWGRSTAFEVRGAEFDWEGVVYTWSVSLDPTALMERNEPLEHLVHAQGYTPLEHFITAEAFETSHEVFSGDVIRLVQSGVTKAIHLGERESNRVGSFMESYPPDIWSSIVQRTYTQSKAKFEEFVSKRVDWERAKEDFTRKINAMKAANLYYRQEKYSKAAIERLSEIYRALLEGLAEPEIRLESVAYVRLVKRIETEL